MRAHGFGERVVLGTDIYEIFTAALRRLVLRAPVLTLPSHEVAGTVNFTAECACFRCAAAKNRKLHSKSRTSPAY
jgi:hypothetical protein